MDDLTRMLAEQDCRNVLIDYCAAFDARQGDVVASLFAKDAHWSRPGQPHVEGSAAIGQMASAVPENVVITHVLSNIRVRVIDGDSATSRSLFTVYSAVDGIAPQGMAPSLVGEYRDQLRRTASGWRIANRDSRYLARPA